MKHSYISCPMDRARQPIDMRPKRIRAASEEPLTTTVSAANVAKYVNAKVSLAVYGAVADDIYAARVAACRACPALRTQQAIADAVGFCADCGCGVKADAALSVKLTMPNATCPRATWLPTHPEAESVVGRAVDWFAKKVIG